MGTELILILITLSFMVLLFLHHYRTHRFDAKKSAIQKWFQWNDINNHETIVVGLVGFILGLLVFSFL